MAMPIQTEMIFYGYSMCPIIKKLITHEKLKKNVYFCKKLLTIK